MNEIATLEARIAALEEERDTLADEVKALQLDVSDLTEERDALTSKVYDAQRLADEIVRELHR
ncbi:hypothetical protein FKN01_29755 [Streptomyces sp. 130]|uniref:hypothetical protein n=1 Tax=Streptomyces sp. 130 TaxID=2591006 RepID=UPI0011802512|nr:hypothetical protein [Streptomyces sp. 130]TRV72576.1 hypothetical protein FKN01_29755 [Streptomyces sp. 130]